ncbi:hypothetical protein M422DRAFT_45163 [Sphaerobolus stellatus SS14]|nr:hypothetical protein M422DRAFT_45163 [Sphaerobolus stellatus SS14]
MAAHAYSDTTLTEPPLSPFSNRSLISDGTHTSDEPADLGAFRSVFRVMNQLQAQQQTVLVRSRPDSRATTFNESESEVGETSTAWTAQLLDSYLDDDDHDDTGRSVSPYTLSDEEEDENGENSSSDTESGEGEKPTLGDFGSALDFLDAEKAKLNTVRESANALNERKRKRRRKRKGISRPEDQPYATVVPSPEDSSSVDLSSSPDKGGLTTSSSVKSRRPKSSRPPSDLFLTSPPPIPLRPSVDPRLLQLRALAQKLRRQFPQNDSRLKQILLDDKLTNNLIDPRGRGPDVGDPLTHVFIDHSNILIGFLNYIRRSRKPGSGKPLLYFPALSLILERGRPVTWRVLAASSPLYQNIDIAKELGYSVHVYARVPDLGENGNGTEPIGSTNGDTSATSGGTPITSVLGLKNMGTKGRKPASTSISRYTTTTTESDPGLSPRNGRPSAHTRSISIPSVSNLASSATSLPSSQPSGTPQRIRYREQGVDELLQLKLHQALLSPEADPLPPGATIVLATGDGASGQFNEDGFVGAVRTALKKGWNVELYAWASGVSGVWRRIEEDKENGKDGRGRFKVWTIDSFGSDLVE